MGHRVFITGRPAKSSASSTYPIVVDSTKLATVYIYIYRMDSEAAFTQNAGSYAR